MKKSSWLICSICGGKTRNQVREVTVLINYSLFCSKCKKITLINVKQLNMSLIKEPDAQTQS